MIGSVSPYGTGNQCGGRWGDEAGGVRTLEIPIEWPVAPKGSPPTAQVGAHPPPRHRSTAAGWKTAFSVFTCWCSWSSCPP